MKSDTKTFSSKDVAKRLSIEPVTVRKYSHLLEEQGYDFFKKDEKGWRHYSEEDIRFLEYLCNMKATGKTLEESVKHVATLYQASLSIAKPSTALQEESDPVLIFMKAQQEFNQKMLERLEKQEERQIERDKQLMAALRETQEVKKQIAMSKEKKWWRFW